MLLVESERLSGRPLVLEWLDEEEADEAEEVEWADEEDALLLLLLLVAAAGSDAGGSAFPDRDALVDDSSLSLC